MELNDQKNYFPYNKRTIRLSDRDYMFTERHKKIKVFND